MESKDTPAAGIKPSVNLEPDGGVVLCPCLRMAARVMCW